MPRELNPEQRAAVDTHEGYIVMMAAPGSGKTTVITNRADKILAKGIPTEKFLSLTFTKEAAKEMTARAGKQEAGVKIFSTFHSWALRFVTKESNSFSALGYNLRHFPLATPYEAAKVLGRIVGHIPELRKNKDARRDAASFISVCKRKNLTPTTARLQAKNDEEDAFCTVFARYDESLRKLGVMDFDSIICETAKLLEKRADVRNRWRYDYIQMDEAQDTDSVQWKIVELINNGNVFAVGDENQGMYSWRGSESNLVERFVARFPSATVLPLSVNYRSTPEIVQYCKEIAPIQNETVTNLSTPNLTGTVPEFRRYGTDWEEAKGIVNSITDLGNTAILVRTNHQLRAFEDECGERGLKYKLLGKSGFWGQGEVKDIMAFVQHVIAPTDASTVRIIKGPYEYTKFLRKAEVVEILEGVQARRLNTDKGTSKLHTLLGSFPEDGSGQRPLVLGLETFLYGLRREAANRQAGDAVKLILDRTGMMNYYADDEDSEGIDNNPVDNLREVIKVANSKGTLQNFLDYTIRVHRASLARKGFLTLSTIHQSKGKEWDTVFVAGVNEDVLPHIHGDEEEEKRIYFVACSRAAKRLHVSGNGVVSKFIKEKCPPPEAENAVETDPWAGWRLGTPGI